MCFVFSPKFQSPNSKFSPFKPKSKSKSLAFESKSKSNSSKIGLESDLSPSPGLESYNSTALPLNVYADILNFLFFVDLIGILAALGPTFTITIKSPILMSAEKQKTSLVYQTK